MTYCVGIITREGLVMASDSRTNASYDQVNVCRKMHTIVDPGERVFILLTSGSLSCSQSIMTLLGRDFDQGNGLAAVGLDVRRRPRRRRPGPARLGDGSAGARARSLLVQRPHPPRRANPGPTPRPLPGLSPGQSPARDRGFAVPPDRRGEVRPSDPRPRCPLRPDHARRCVALCADLARLDDALERDGRARRSTCSSTRGTSCASAASGGSSPRTPTCSPSTPSGSSRSARPSRSSLRSASIRPVPIPKFRPTTRVIASRGCRTPRAILAPAESRLRKARTGRESGLSRAVALPPDPREAAEEGAVRMLSRPGFVVVSQRVPQ